MQRTVLYEEHIALGARMVDFAGWEMPVQYAGVLEEHRAVRSGAGLFDLGHMAEIRVHGNGAGAALDHAVVSSPSAIPVGRAQYSMIVDESGGMLDDLVIYRPAEQEWLVVANASNRSVVVAALRERIEGLATVDDESGTTAMVAIQGPASARALASIIEDGDRSTVESLRNYASTRALLRLEDQDVPAFIARTGYTGEDGFELYLPHERAVALWRALLRAGDSDSTNAIVQPVGLGARDTLRLEAGMPLYGNELRREITPFDVGLGRVVKFDKPSGFTGEPALAVRAERGERFGRTLVGLRVTGRGIARYGYALRRPGGANLGSVTSGTHSPTLGYPIALADLDAAEGPFRIGEPIEVLIRGEAVAAEVTGVPFIPKRPAEGRSPETHKRGG